MIQSKQIRHSSLSFTEIYVETIFKEIFRFVEY